MGMQLKNIGFIQKQDDTIKPRLSTAYMNITATRDPADPFAPTKKPYTKFKDPLNPIKESGEASLAAQMGIDEAGFASAVTVDKIFEKQGGVKQMNEKAGMTTDGAFDLAVDAKKVAGVPSNQKIRGSNLFETKDYFNKKMKQELNMIDENKEERPSNATKQEEYLAEEQKREAEALIQGTEINTEGIAVSKPELSIGGVANILAEEHKQVFSAGIGSGVDISDRGVSSNAEIGIGGDSMEEKKLMSVGRISVGRDVLSAGQGVSVGIDPTGNKVIGKQDVVQGYTQDKGGISIEGKVGFESQTEEEIVKKGSADSRIAKERIKGGVEVGIGEQAERIEDEAKKQERVEGKTRVQTMEQLTVTKDQAEETQEGIEKQQIGIGEDNEFGGIKVLTEEEKSQAMVGVSQRYVGSKKNELSVGGTNMISKEGLSKEQINRPALSLGTTGNITTEATAKKSPFSTDISKAGEELSSKGVNEISAGEGINIQGKVNKEEAKAGEQKSSAEMSIGMDKEQESKKVAAEKTRNEATKAMQEKLANKIKEQKKKIEAALGTTALDIRPSKITTFDFLTLKKNPKITKILTSLREANSAIIFSDYVYVIREDNMAHKSKRILYITEYSIFIMHHKTYQIQRVIPITDLKMLIIVKTSGSLIAFHFEKA
jgi:hypothetical protein